MNNVNFKERRWLFNAQQYEAHPFQFFTVDNNSAPIDHILSLFTPLSMTHEKDFAFYTTEQEVKNIINPHAKDICAFNSHFIFIEEHLSYALEN